MQKISLDAMARQQMELAVSAGGGHTADTVFGGHEKVLRQPVLNMKAGARLAEHENPGEATVLVLHGGSVGGASLLGMPRVLPLPTGAGSGLRPSV